MQDTEPKAENDIFLHELPQAPESTKSTFIMKLLGVKPASEVKKQSSKPSLKVSPMGLKGLRFDVKVPF